MIIDHYLCILLYTELNESVEKVGTTTKDTKNDSDVEEKVDVDAEVDIDEEGIVALML